VWLLRAIAAALLAAVATVVAPACARDRPGAVVARAVPDKLPPPPPLALSHFNLPVTYDFSPVLAIVERVVPATFGSIDSLHAVATNDRMHYAYEATRGQFTAFAQGRLLHLRTTLSYSARGVYKPPIGPTVSAGCGLGNDRPRVTVELVTPLTLGANWHLVSHASIERLAPASASSSDRCAVSIIRYDVTDRVIDAARSALASHLGDIDRKVAHVDLTGQFETWWALLNKPIQLTDGVWLLLDPERLRVGSVRGAGKELTIQAGLDARPHIVTGTEPALPVPCLPSLAHDTAGTGFNVTLEGAMDYATASQAITAALRGDTVREAGRSVTIQNVRVSPLSRGRLALAVAFTGDASGTLAFQGTPRYDPSTRELTVPDLDYDLVTDNALISAYAWLRSDALRQLFRSKARVSVGPLLDRGKALLLGGLNRNLGDAVTLSATVDSVAVGGLYVTTQGVVVRAAATGNAAMAVRQGGGGGGSGLGSVAKTNVRLCGP